MCFSCGLTLSTVYYYLKVHILNLPLISKIDISVPVENTILLSLLSLCTDLMQQYRSKCMYYTVSNTIVRIPQIVVESTSIE